MFVCGSGLFVDSYIFLTFVLFCLSCVSYISVVCLSFIYLFFICQCVYMSSTAL